MRLIIILFLVIIQLAVSSCKNTTPDNQSISLIQDEAEIKFLSKGIDSVIHEYVTKYEVNPSKRILHLSVYRDPFRSVYHLTQIRRQKHIEREIPDKFFIHDGKFVVLLYFGGSDLFTSLNTLKDITSEMQKLGIALEKDSLDFNPPSWEFIKKCDGKMDIRSKSDFVLNFVPCGYEIRQDSLGLPEFVLVKY